MKKTLILLSLLAASVAMGEDLTLTSGEVIDQTYNIDFGPTATFTKNGYTTGITEDPNWINVTSLATGATGILDSSYVSLTLDPSDTTGVGFIGGAGGMYTGTMPEGVPGTAGCDSLFINNGRTLTLTFTAKVAGTYSFDIMGARDDNFGMTYTINGESPIDVTNATLTNVISSWEVTQDMIDSGSNVQTIVFTNTGGKVAALNYAQVSCAVATPEPTTATLSLLALAGLCARRRRK